MAVCWARRVVVATSWRGVYSTEAGAIRSSGEAGFNRSSGEAGAAGLRAGTSVTSYGGAMRAGRKVAGAGCTTSGGGRQGMAKAGTGGGRRGLARAGTGRGEASLKATEATAPSSEVIPTKHLILWHFELFSR